MLMIYSKCLIKKYHNGKLLGKLNTLNITFSFELEHDTEISCLDNWITTAANELQTS